MKFSSKTLALKNGSVAKLSFKVEGTTVPADTEFTVAAEGLSIQVYNAEKVDGKVIGWENPTSFTQAQLGKNQVRVVYGEFNDAGKLVRSDKLPEDVKNLKITATIAGQAVAHTLSVEASDTVQKASGEEVQFVNTAPSIEINEGAINFFKGTKSTPAKTLVTLGWFTVSDEGEAVTVASAAYKISISSISKKAALGGFFAKNGVKTGSFTLADIEDGIVTFVNSGSESIQFAASVKDGFSKASPKDLTDGVIAFNPAPVIDEAGSTLTGSAASSHLVSGKVVANDLGDSLTYSSSNPAFVVSASGVWTFDPSHASVTLDPASNKTTITVTDSKGLTDTVTVVVNVSAKNAAPVIDEAASDLIAASNSRDAVTGKIVAADADTATLTYSISDSTGFSVNSSGVWSFSPAGSDGVKSATVTVSDGKSASDTVVVSVTQTNAVPVINEAASDLIAASNSRDAVTGKIVAADADTATLTYSISDSTGFSVNSSGVWSFSPAGSDGVKTAVITVSDGKGASDTVTVSVTQTDALPVINEATSDLSVKAVGVDTVGGTIVATDADGVIAFAVTGTGFTINAATGIWSFDPKAGKIGNNEATVTVSSNGKTDTVKVSVAFELQTQFTAQVDNIVGTSSNDTFSAVNIGNNADGIKLSSFDKADGGSGTDTLNFEDIDSSYRAGPQLSSIENLVLTGTSPELSLLRSSGVEWIKAQDANDVSVTNITAALSRGVELSHVEGARILFTADTVAGLADSLSVKLDAVSKYFETDGVETLSLMTQTAASEFDLTDSGLKTLVVTGDKNLTVSNWISPATVTAGSFTGNLNLKVLTATTNVTSGSGNDTLAFEGTNVTVNSGAGTDSLTLQIQYPSTFIATAGTGTDTLNLINAGSVDLRGSTGLESIIADLNDQSVTVTAAEILGLSTLDLGLGNDTLVVSGTVDLATIATVSGIEIIQGLGSNDSITVKNADSDVFGGDGNDTILGSSGNDDLSGEGGNDTIVGNAGSDIIFGGAGNDSLNGGEGVDTVNGDAGDDTITLSAGADTYNGGDDADTLKISGVVDLNGYIISNIETLLGSAGEDTVTLKANTIGFTAITGVETLSVSGIADFSAVTLTGVTSIVSTAGVDTITGSAGGDVFVLSAGADTYNGGNGSDTLFVSGTVNLNTYTLSNFETLLGSAGEDTVTLKASSAIGFTAITGVETLSVSGTADFSGVVFTGVTSIVGSAGADTITGSAGDDLIVLSTGADTYNGGTGNDTLSISGVVDLNGYTISNIDTLLGSADADTVTLKANSAIGFTAITGVDTLMVSGTANFSTVTLTGVTSIVGSADADTITGSAGDDSIVGGNGIDTLTGGLGADTFDLSALIATANRDVITDFLAGTDKLNIQDLVVNFAADAAAVTALNVAGPAAYAYQADTGALYYDANGDFSAGKELIASLTAATVLTVTDFV